MKLQNENNENNIEIFKDSSIVNDDERKMILDWIAPINNNKSFKSQLLYKASSHGDNPSSFHSYWDNKGPTITFFTHYSTGYRLGVFTNYTWQRENGNYQNAPNAFLFSLNNRKKFNTKNPNGYRAIYIFIIMGIGDLLIIHVVIIIILTMELLKNL